MASKYAYHLLTEAGYKRVSRYAGGVANWEEAGHPMKGKWAESTIGQARS